MADFIIPEISGIQDLSEGVFAGSGSIPTPEPTPEVVVTPCWKISCRWRNHNSGSHSELEIEGYHNGDHSGESVTMNFLVTGFVLDNIVDCGGCLVSNVSDSGFTIKRTGHFNPNDHFVFNIQLTAKDSPYHGSVGKTGVDIPCNIVCTSYICG